MDGLLRTSCCLQARHHQDSHVKYDDNSICRRFFFADENLDDAASATKRLYTHSKAKTLMFPDVDFRPNKVNSFSD